MAVTAPVPVSQSDSRSVPQAMGDDYAERMAQYGVAPKEEVAAAAATPGCAWLDVRSLQEVQEQPLPPVRGAKPHCPVWMDEANDLVSSAAALLPDKDAPVICFCAVGGRAGVAKAALEDAGYTAVVNGGGLADVHALASTLTAEGRLAALGIEFPELAPMGRYVPYRLIGNMLYVSGSSARPRVIGKVGGDVSLDEAKAAARSTGVSLLSIIKQAIGTLDGVKRVVKSLGMVNGIPEFGDHPAVVDGYAELMTDIFGEDGWVNTQALAPLTTT